MKTLIITGAGSNVSYGFPTGAGLRRSIIESSPGLWHNYYSQSALSGDPHRKTRTEDLLKDFITEFKDSSFSSIDNFLNVNKQFADVGKLAIFLSICKAEIHSKFREDLGSRRDDDWLFWIFNKFVAPSISAPDRIAALNSLNLRFITFNYDRSIEAFLSKSLLSSVPVGLERDALLQSLPRLPFMDIVHMYGQLAPLPFQGKSLPALQYAELPKVDLVDYISNLRLIGERRAADATQLAYLFEWADNIFFIGFGFDAQNMLALELQSNLSEKHALYVTSHGTVPRERSDTKAELVKAGVPDHKVKISRENILFTLREYMIA